MSPLDSANADWSKWSMFLIEGMKSMSENIKELYQLVHDLDMNMADGRQKIIKDFTQEIQKVKNDLQKDINATNVEIARLQTKMAFWSAFFAFIGTIIGGFVVYLFKDLILKIDKP